MTPSAPAAALVLALLISSPALAQTSGERIPDTVKTGLKVSIIDDQGRQIDGRVDGISEETLRVSLRKGSEEVRLDRIVRIDRPDSLRNGALIGLGFGVANSAILVGFATQSDSDNIQWPAVVLASVSNIVGYTLLGTGIDAMFNNRRTLYERGRHPQARLTPVVGRGVRGGAISLTW
jgi:hypothetical protein